MDSVRHAKEGHLGPGGVAGGLAAAANLHSFEEEDYDDEFDSSQTDESYTSSSGSLSSYSRKNRNKDSGSVG